MLHGLTIFISAFLLLLVQLIIGKRILPWFGGAPSVWTTCMLFFQLLLLGGYVYAHLLGTRLSNRRQVQIHGGMLVISGLLLSWLWWQWGNPILPGEHWKPATPDRPIWQILKLLTASVGLPFFILSATSPLLQRWYSLGGAREETYRLYALSNAGSMVALLGYPFLLEPVTGVAKQGHGWGVLYMMFIAACIGCAMKLPANGVGGREISGDEVPDIRPGCLRILLWMFLAACASAMLLAVTNSLCQEVAVVPFLWVLPLALYLLSFILCFDSSRWYRRRWFLLLGAIASIAVLITAFRGVQLKIAWHVISYGMFLFFFCMTCHGELVRLKPTTRYLTLFYLMVALGGAVGGIFVGIVAPMFFKGYWEFHIVLMAGWILLALVLAFDMTSPFHRGDRLHFYLLLFVLGFVIAQFSQLLFGLSLPLPVPGIVVSILLSAVVTGVFAIVTRNAAFVDSKYWPRILVGAIIFIAECFVLQRVRSNDSTSVRMDRNFYGVTTVMRRVTAEEPRLPILHLMHGQINHGAQILDDNWRTRPISYYSEETGVGLAFRFHPRRQKNEPVNAGVLGLGVGTLASYAREQDRFKFYEINPIVAGYSTGEDALFSYIKESCGQVDVVMGDARVSLERELQSPNAFDVLVMDVFSSDAVPVHLLTREAFEIYMRHLRDEDSIMAIHISNRFLDLRDLVANTARQFGLETIVIDYERKAAGNTASLWCLLTRSKTFLNHPELAKGQRIKGSATGLIWTDDYSNLFRVLK